MVRKLFLFCILLLLVSCGEDSRHFKIEGRLMQINQSEFYIYSDDGSIDGIDTIQVVGGRFAYEMPCDHAATLMLVFPNFSEQPVFAEPGKSVDISGSASHLKEMKVEGTKTNELMTAFRLHVANASPPEARQYAARFINDNPASPIAIYLLRRYFIAGVNPDYKQAAKLLKVIRANHEPNLQLNRLSKELEALGHAPTGSALPQFSVRDIHGRQMSSTALSQGVSVICAWASWSYTSTEQLRTIHETQEQGGSQLKVFTISLDGSKSDCEINVKRFGDDWLTYCSGEMFQTPLLQQLGLLTVPDNIVVRNGKIVARSLQTPELISKLKSML